MSTKLIIREALGGNPIAVKDLIESELQKRIRDIFEAKKSDEEDDDKDDSSDEEDDDKPRGKATKVEVNEISNKLLGKYIKGASSD
jgi:hypothetical protein